MSTGIGHYCEAAAREATFASEDLKAARLKMPFLMHSPNTYKKFGVGPELSG